MADEQTPAAPEDPNQDAPADLRTLRAIAHPLRAELLEAIRLHGPLTATQAAARVDDTPSNCSFHLRTLAAAGLIEQAESGDARSRPWRTVHRRLILDPGKSVASRTAFSTAVSLMQSQSQQGLMHWTATSEEAPPEWQEASFSNLLTIRMTAAELADVQARIKDLLGPYLTDTQRREVDPTGARVPVRLSLYAYPSLPDPLDPPHT